jgi:hypothetical protein
VNFFSNFALRNFKAVKIPRSMKNQKDYISDFRMEAEEVIDQHVAQFHNSNSPDRSFSTRDEQREQVERKLHTKLHEIIIDAGDDDGDELHSELMHYYHDYIDDFAERSSR